MDRARQIGIMVTKMMNNQVPPCPFSKMECLQWWAFTPVKRHPLHNFGPEIGVGVCPRVGLYPALYGICKKYLVKLGYFRATGTPLATRLANTHTECCFLFL